MKNGGSVLVTLLKLLQMMAQRRILHKIENITVLSILFMRILYIQQQSTFSQRLPNIYYNTDS